MTDKKYLMVPVEPTNEMLCAAFNAVNDLFTDEAIAAYKAMIAAAPTPPEQPAQPIDPERYATAMKYLGYGVGIESTQPTILGHIGPPPEPEPIPGHTGPIPDPVPLKEPSESIRMATVVFSHTGPLGAMKVFEDGTTTYTPADGVSLPISDAEIVESFQDAIDAYQDPNQSWGISREYAIDTVRSIKAAMQAEQGTK